MANITLKIEDELLEKARRLAIQRKTSINAVVRQRLEEFIFSDLSREATLKGLEAFFSAEQSQGRKEDLDQGRAS